MNLPAFTVGILMFITPAAAFLFSKPDLDRDLKRQMLYWISGFPMRTRLTLRAISISGLLIISFAVIAGR